VEQRTSNGGAALVSTLAQAADRIIKRVDAGLIIGIMGEAWQLVILASASNAMKIAC
jgi:hypothetical protein